MFCSLVVPIVLWRRCGFITCFLYQLNKKKKKDYYSTCTLRLTKGSDWQITHCACTVQNSNFFIGGFTWGNTEPKTEVFRYQRMTESSSRYCPYAVASPLLIVKFERVLLNQWLKLSNTIACIARHVYYTFKKQSIEFFQDFWKSARNRKLPEHHKGTDFKKNSCCRYREKKKTSRKLSGRRNIVS